MPRRRNPFDLSVAAPRLSSERQDGISMETEIPGCNYFFYGATCRATFSFSSFSFFFSFFSFFTNGRESSIEDERRRKKVGPVFSSGLRPFRVFILIGRLSVHGFSPAHLISGAARVEARSRRKRCRAASYGWSSPTTTSCDDR